MWLRCRGLADEGGATFRVEGHYKGRELREEKVASRGGGYNERISPGVG